MQRTYGPGGGVISEADALGHTTTTYDHRGYPKTSTDSFGDSAILTYNAAGHLTRMQEADGTMFTFDYDAFGRETYADYGHGITIATTYDEGPHWSVREGPTLGRTGRRYTPSGKLAGWELANGHTVKFEYHQQGHFVKETGPTHVAIHYERDEVGRLSRITDEQGHVLEQRHLDPAGRLIERVDALGDREQLTYTPDGRLKTFTNSRHQTWTYDYTPTSVRITDPLRRTTTTHFHPCGLPIRTVFADMSQSEATYWLTTALEDGQDYPTAFTNPGGHRRAYTYTPLGQLASATNLAGGLYQYTYVKDERRAITDPANDSLRLTYDARDNIETVIYPDLTEQRWHYNAANLPEVITQPAGTTITLTYDAARRPRSRRTSTGEWIEWTWTPHDRIETLTDSTGITSYTYSPRGTLDTITFPSGAQLRYHWNLRDQLTAIEAQVAPHGPMYRSEYVFDGEDNLVRVVDPFQGQTTLVYDAVNRLERRVLPNGVISRYSYNDRDQMTRIVHEDAQGQVLASVAYTRHLGGEPHRIEWEDGTYVILDYDAALRLQTETYYNAAGAVSDRQSYAYDAAGKRVGRTDISGVTTYHYGSGWQLESQSGVQPAAYEYDADGRLKRLMRNGLNWHLRYTIVVCK